MHLVPPTHSLGRTLTWHAPLRALACQACLRSLRELRLDTFDLYLVHWPCASGKASGTSLAATWHQMEALVRDGFARAIGVSNFSASKLGALLDEPTLEIRPAVNQVGALGPAFTWLRIGVGERSWALRVHAVRAVGSSASPRSPLLPC